MQLTSDYALDWYNPPPNFQNGGTISGNLTVSGTTTISGNTFPTTQGSSGQILQTNGTGGLSWTDKQDISGLLSASTAASTYLSQSSAASTYLTKSNAYTPPSTIVAGIINANGSFSASLDNKTLTIQISSTNTNVVLSSLAITSPSQYQEITLKNKSLIMVVLSDIGTNMKCGWFVLYPNHSVRLLYDSDGSCWVLSSSQSYKYQFRPLPWTGDNVLTSFINGSAQFHAKIAFGTTSTFNSVTGFESWTSSTAAGTNWSANEVGNAKGSG